MSSMQVLFHQDGPVGVFGSSSAAMRAIHDLPSWADSDLFLVNVPFEPLLSATGGTVVAVPAGEPRVSAAAGAGRVTLSPNGNKKE